MQGAKPKDKAQKVVPSASDGVLHRTANERSIHKKLFKKEIGWEVGCVWSPLLHWGWATFNQSSILTAHCSFTSSLFLTMSEPVVPVQSSIPTHALRNGVPIPVIGCGTAVFEDIGPRQRNLSGQFAKTIVHAAVQTGVTPLLVDTAHMYYNEEEIGLALQV